MRERGRRKRGRSTRMNKDELIRLVVFCILMQNGEGIIGKSPGYIVEKFKSSMNTLFPENLLDEPNKKKLIEWLATWEPEEI